MLSSLPGEARSPQPGSRTRRPQGCTAATKAANQKTTHRVAVRRQVGLRERPARFRRAPAVRHDQGPEPATQSGTRNNTASSGRDAAAPDTVNPSLWRQAQLINLSGLFKVADGIYQVRNLDLSNMTIIEGREGITIVDPLVSAETAKVGLDLYYANRGESRSRR